METKLLDYNLPQELIAQNPCQKRSQSRLLVMKRHSKNFTDTSFSNIADYFKEGDLLVLNNTKVLPARFFCRRKTGANLEALFLCEPQAGTWQVMLKGLRKVKNGETIILCDRHSRDFCNAKIKQKLAEGKSLLEIDSTDSSQKILEDIGFAPLPPYIKRKNDPRADQIDRQRYQTVYAQEYGAVAAPTAGLHFTDELIEQIKNIGVEFACVTLHVGAGTFKPVTTENLTDHEIHKEIYSIDEKNAHLINCAKGAGRRIVAVGTTSVRTLETAGNSGRVEPCQDSTQLFITPGCQFKIVDAMVTNFHLPKSTLIALVAAFTGLENILAAYQHAIEHKYRFYSYGDAMLII